MQNQATIIKRIRTTNYLVNVHFGTASKESVHKTMLRLMQNELATNLTIAPRNSC